MKDHKLPPRTPLKDGFTKLETIGIVLFQIVGILGYALLA